MGESLFLGEWRVNQEIAGVGGMTEGWFSREVGGGRANLKDDSANPRQSAFKLAQQATPSAH